MGSRTTGQVRDFGFSAPSSEPARSADSRPIASGSRSAGERPSPNPSPVWRSPFSTAIAFRNAYALVASKAPSAPRVEAIAIRSDSSA